MKLTLNGSQTRLSLSLSTGTSTSLSLTEGVAIVAPENIYTGITTVTPSEDEQVLETYRKTMPADVVIEAIPYAEVSNLAGGLTATIGG